MLGVLLAHSAIPNRPLLTMRLIAAARARPPRARLADARVRSRVRIKVRSRIRSGVRSRVRSRGRNRLGDRAGIRVRVRVRVRPPRGRPVRPIGLITR